MERIVCILIGYVFGLFQTGYIYGRLQHVDCLLYTSTRVMGIKGDNVGYSHVNQFLQCLGTVQRFAFGTFVLAAFVKKRHDDI